MCDVIYTIGMVEDLRRRGKTIVTAEDEALMKSRWVRQLLHQELDATREAAIGSAEEPAVDLVVSGALAVAEQESITLETEQAEWGKISDRRTDSVIQKDTSSETCVFA